ncbi:spore coat protein U domain-containing protein [Acinetobacter sp. SA01]|uniref:Csu type fimbrial protein n=1 Tax=Acinetobacter sp. SA01 TaxID=1862567 RepID=UPI00140C0F20|nr:spore coat protein U domain-containing protein [Acinetobacter sp. SA01]
MRLKNRLSVLVIASTAILGYSNYANAAGTLSGQIGVEVTIGSGCSVANSGGDTNTWGTLNFGEYSDLVNTINGSVVGTAATVGLQVTCSTDLPYTLTFNNGLNASGGLRRLNLGANYIPYHLYSDATYTTSILNAPLSRTGTGSLESIPIFGRILPSDQTTTAPAAGKYIDTVTATLIW